MAQDVFIGAGSNLGNRQEALAKAAELLAPDSNVIKTSRLYETPPWGFEDQPVFLNQVLQVETELDPPALLDYLKQIERKMGRKSTFHFGPRIIDLDILFYGGLIYTSDRLQIPHALAAERAFVMVPMCEIAPDFIHPALGKSMADLARLLDSTGITIFEGGVHGVD